MNSGNISKEDISVVFPKVAEIMADALGCDTKDIKLGSTLIEGLGAESIDFLDIIFRLERSFKMKLPRGKIVEEARGDLSDAQFEVNGMISDAGLERLKSYLSEVPAERFTSPLSATEIPRLFTVETFCKMVIRQQRTATASAD